MKLIISIFAVFMILLFFEKVNAYDSQISERIKSTDIIDSTFMNDILYDEINDIKYIYLSYEGGQKPHFLVKLDANKIKTILNSSAFNFPYSNSTNFKLNCLDSKKNLWISKGNKLLKFDGKTWQEFSIPILEQFPHNACQMIIPDSSDNVFTIFSIGRLKGTLGLIDSVKIFKINAKNEISELVKNKIDFEFTNLAFLETSSYVTDNDGNIWIATLQRVGNNSVGNGLLKLNTKNFEFSAYKLENQDHNNRKADIFPIKLVLDRYDKNKFWFLYRNDNQSGLPGGISNYDMINNQWTQLDNLKLNLEDTYKFTGFTTFEFDDNFDILIGRFYDGICRIYENNSKFKLETFSQNFPEDTFKIFDQILNSFRDKNNNIWFQTYGGLLKLSNTSEVEIKTESKFFDMSNTILKRNETIIFRINKEASTNVLLEDKIEIYSSNAELIDKVNIHAQQEIIYNNFKLTSGKYFAKFKKTLIQFLIVN